MVHSMTGYGNSIVKIKETTIKVELRSVNHRFLDVNPKLPRSLLYLEERLKKTIKDFFYRGRIELFVSIEGNIFVEKSLHTDWDMLQQYMDQLMKAKEQYGLTGDIPISILPSLPELFSVQEMEQQPTELEHVVIQAAESACQSLLTMRQKEGENLEADIRLRLTNIDEMIRSLEEQRKNVTEEYRNRIYERIQEYVSGITLENSKIHQEIALLAEKGDITEEIVRIKSHIEYFIDILSHQQGIGRKMDFIIQEMQREVNTIGSKSTDRKIGQYVVDLKSEMEKIKEQVQNIE